MDACEGSALGLDAAVNFNYYNILLVFLQDVIKITYNSGDFHSFVWRCTCGRVNPREFLLFGGNGVIL